MAALAAIGLQHVFSAVAGANLTGTLIWAALAIVVAGSFDQDLVPSAQLVRRPAAVLPPMAALSSSANARARAATSSTS